MTVCPKCGYERQEKDDTFVSKNECPKCGILYHKFTEKRSPSNEDVQPIYTRQKNNHSFLWGALICLLVLLVFKVIPNKMDKAHNARNGGVGTGVSGKSSPAGTTAKAIPQVGNPRLSPSEPVGSVARNHASRPTAYDSNRELSNAIEKMTRTYERTLSEMYVYHNEIPQHRWDTVKNEPNYKKIQSMMRNYHNQHTYVGNDFFVCVDMAVNVWNLLATSGIRSKLMVGNTQRDITHEDTIVQYVSAMNHAWVLAEVSPSIWIPIETTGGYIVEPSMPNFELYNKGTVFSNPKDFKDFNVSRKEMFDTRNETKSMLDDFNRMYAGKPITAETTEYVGRMKQKISDCEDLIGKVTDYLQRR